MRNTHLLVWLVFYMMMENRRFIHIEVEPRAVDCRILWIWPCEAQHRPTLKPNQKDRAWTLWLPTCPRLPISRTSSLQLQVHHMFGTNPNSPALPKSDTWQATYVTKPRDRSIMISFLNDGIHLGGPLWIHHCLPGDSQG